MSVEWKWIPGVGYAEDCLLMDVNWSNVCGSVGADEWRNEWLDG